MHWHTHSCSLAWPAAGTVSKPALTTVGQQSWWLPLGWRGFAQPILASGTGRGVLGSKLNPKRMKYKSRGQTLYVPDNHPDPQVFHAGSFFRDHTGKSWHVLTQQPGLAPMMV